MCPYARCQSAMFDRKTLIIAYDERRGEPRGSRKRGAREAGTRDWGLGTRANTGAGDSGLGTRERQEQQKQLGRESGRERVCQDVLISVCAVSLKTIIPI